MFNFLILMAAILVASSDDIMVLCLGAIAVFILAVVSFLIRDQDA
tara:strand:+ start:652 stop:786 length:135 start_codon:yes stop_codon:yes gene_type:complete